MPVFAAFDAIALQASFNPVAADATPSASQRMPHAAIAERADPPLTTPSR